MTVDPQQRRRGIGGSDVAAILGISPFKTRLDVWRQKVLGDLDDTSPAMERGTRFEPAILRAYAMKHDALLRGSADPIVRDWRIANIDMRAEAGGWPRIVEAKCTGFDDDWGSDGTDQIPPYYYTQVQWYLDLDGCEIADLPILVLPPSPRDLRNLLGLPAEEIVERVGIRTYTVTYDDGAATHCRSEAQRFWEQNVLAEVPPAPIDLDDAKRLWWCRTGKVVEADAALLDRLRSYDKLREAEKEIEKQVEAAQFALRSTLHDAEMAMLGGKPIVTLKTTKRADGVSFRSLRLTKHWNDLRGDQQ